MHPAQGIPVTVLLVDDQRTTRTVLEAELRALGVQTIWQAESGEKALEVFKQHRPDIVLLDILMPGRDGYWAARQIRENEQGGWTPIIFLSTMGNDLDLSHGIEAGGDDYLVKPVSPTVLQAKLRAMQRLLNMRRRLVAVTEDLHHANQQLNEMVEHDALTGLVNRRGFDRILNQEIRAARRDQLPLTLMLCDIDHFKLYNDNHGHVAGDEVLRQVGQRMRQICLRPADIAVRYGGEEFALILPNTPKSGAMTFARALAQALAQLQLPHPNSPTAPRITLSGGITTCVPDDGTTSETMVMRADQALYAAKSQGRNCFFSFEMQMNTEEQRHR